ncbi:MAG: DNA-processing protein DprA [Acidobacteria bacterium]|nr:DNA-processing protein DprA [Acidobacteriota bacterium]
MVSDVLTERDTDVVARALLRPGPDTAACRLLKDEDLGLLELARQLQIAEPEVAGRIEEARRRASGALAAARARGLSFLPLRAPEYPAWLAQIPDPPVGLWWKGVAPLPERSVAIVGSRRATPAGLLVARQLARDLATAGWTIVSGMALGVDGAAHAAALEAGGTTVAVLGCGADIVYPYAHRVLAERITAQGQIVSEFLPGTPPCAWHFPLRNRIISGLSRAVVVVEASDKSGSLITARLAMEQGRDVLAVPGGVASGRYRGCHALIKDGARLVETVDDVLDELEGVSRRPLEGQSGKLMFISDLEAQMAVGEPYGVDDLASLTGRLAADLLSELGSLEVEGRIARTAGGYFVRLDAAANVTRGTASFLWQKH